MAQVEEAKEAMEVAQAKETAEAHINIKAREEANLTMMGEWRELLALMATFVTR